MQSHSHDLRTVRAGDTEFRIQYFTMKDGHGKRLVEWFSLLVWDGQNNRWLPIERFDHYGDAADFVDTFASAA